MTRIARLPVLLLVLLGLAACATGGAPADPDEPTILEVDNQSTFTMTIYVLGEGGQRRRIGEAPSLSTARMTIPSTMIFGLTPLRFQADPVGSSRTPISNELTVTPGDTVVLVIPPR